VNKVIAYRQRLLYRGVLNGVETIGEVFITPKQSLFARLRLAYYLIVNKISACEFVEATKDCRYL